MLQANVLPNPNLKHIVRITPGAVAAAPHHYFEGRGVALSVDALFDKFVKAHNPYEHLDKEFYCSIYQTNGGTDDSIRTEFCVVRTLTPSVLHVVLRYLSTDEGFALLNIEDGEVETNSIIGYAKGIIYYALHTFEKGVHKIHLCARPALREWGSAKPQVMVF